MNNIRVSLCIDKNTFAKLRRFAVKNHISMSSVVRILINENC